MNAPNLMYCVNASNDYRIIELTSDKKPIVNEQSIFINKFLFKNYILVLF